jgi:TetR/AcrR family transcriptional regulator, regulator of autoinduction and epiphytic fitness
LTVFTNCSRCLDEEGAALDQRVLAALDAWLGRYVGSMLAADISGLLQNPAIQIQDMVDAAVAAFDTRLAKAIAAATAEEDRRRLGVTAEEVAAALHTLGQGAKYLSSSRGASRAEYVARLTPGVRLVLAGLGSG